VTNPFYALLLLISGVGSLIVAGIAWRRRPMAGAAPLAVVMLSMVVWAWMSGAYWLAPALDAKLFWLKLVFIGVVISSPAFVVMAVEFTGHAGWLTRRFYLALSVLPVAALLLLWTDDWFGLFFNGIDILKPEKILSGGIGFWLAVVNGYLNTAFGFVLMVRDFFRQTYLRRAQIGVLLIGTSFPVVLNFISLLKLLPLHGLDVTPIAFSLSGIFYVYGLFHFGMMDLAPMGRNVVLEEMEDSVLVIDGYDRVIDLNPMAKTFIDMDIGNPIGKPMIEVFASWINNTGLNHKMQIEPCRVEVEGPDFYHYDISITPLVDKTGEIVGRTFIWRDISKQKKTEIELREVNIQLNNQLEEVKRLHVQLSEYAIRDSLTGIFNRGYMEETLDRELARANREKIPLSVMMIDIDKFKMVNDTYGHHAGDVVLRALGDLLMKNVRKGDIACRYGGDEMLVVMPNAPIEDAIRRAKELGRLFSELVFNFDDAVFQTTLSMGVASFPTHANSVAELLQVADKALYSSKNERNIIARGYDPLEYNPDDK
jgi:diguanylate cyclase (GGDEF)-like protein